MNDDQNSKIIVEVREDVNLCFDLLKVTAVLRVVLSELQRLCSDQGNSQISKSYINGAGYNTFQIITNICMNLEPPQQYDFLECCGIPEDMIENMLMDIRQKEKMVQG